MIKVKIMLSCLISIVCIGAVPKVFYQDNNEKVVVADTLINNAKSAILMEAETGKILYEYNAHLKSSPASMTKIMSIKLIFDALEAKRLDKDKLLTTSEYASSMGGSQIFLSANEKMLTNDLLKSMIIASANDATVVLAEAISGTEANFVKAMNDEVKKLGLNDTYFSDATGLADDNHYSTPYDMAIIARSLINTHNENVLSYTKIYEDYVRQDTDDPFWLVNTNKLVKHINGVDGLKTGWTSKAGYCLTCTKMDNGMRLISVVMGCSDPKSRTQDTIALLNYGFGNYEKKEIIPKGKVISIEENLKYRPEQIKIITSNRLVLITKKGEEISNYSIEPHVDYQSLSEHKSSNIGYIDIIFDNGDKYNVELTSEKEIIKADFFDILINIIKMLL